MEVRLLKMLKIIASHGWDGFEQPDTRERIARSLEEAGFWRFEIARMYEWLGQIRQENDFEQQIAALLEAVSEPEAEVVPVMNLTERAHSFLTSVRDLGLVDELMEDEILNQLMMHHGAQIALEDIRRTAAMVIFDRQFRTTEEYYGIFEEEWKLLFN